MSKNIDWEKVYEYRHVLRKEYQKHLAGFEPVLEITFDNCYSFLANKFSSMTPSKQQYGTTSLIILAEEISGEKRGPFSA